MCCQIGPLNIVHCDRVYVTFLHTIVDNDHRHTAFQKRLKPLFFYLGCQKQHAFTAGLCNPLDLLAHCRRTRTFIYVGDQQVKAVLACLYLHAFQHVGKKRCICHHHAMLFINDKLHVLLLFRRRHAARFGAGIPQVLHHPHDGIPRFFADARFIVQHKRDRCWRDACLGRYILNLHHSVHLHSNDRTFSYSLYHNVDDFASYILPTILTAHLYSLPIEFPVH